MKRALLIRALTLLCLGAMAPASVDSAETITWRVPIGTVQVTRTDDSLDRINIPGFGVRAIAGEPLVPHKLLHVAIPPDATVESVRFKTATRELPGSVSVAPATMALPGTHTPDVVSRAMAERDANHASVYSSDKFYPDTVARFVGTGTLRRYRYAQIEVMPWQVIPATGQARVLSELTIEIDVVREATAASTASDRGQAAFETEAETMLENYADARAWYAAPSEAMLGSGDYTYLVLGEAALLPDVQPLIDWKRQIGFRVKSITLESIEANPAYAAYDVPGKIRAYLRDNYLAWGSQYLLIVGDTDHIPMRECTVVGTATNLCYTDQYYGELSKPDSTSWDANGNGLYGEYPGDSIDWIMELYVGRLPSNYGPELTRICEAMRDFEMDTGAWKKRALFCTAILNATGIGDTTLPLTDGAYMAKALFDAGYYSDWSVRWGCEDEGVEPSLLPHDFGIALTNVEHEWNSRDYGIVSFTGHGAPEGPLRFLWNADTNGNGKAGHGEYSKPHMLGNVRLNQVTASKPSMVYFGGCNDGRWDEPQAIAKVVLTKGAAVGGIGASVDSFYRIGWKTPNDGGGDQALQSFWHYYVTGAFPQAGKALAYAKFYHCLRYGNNMDMTILGQIYNLFGDPSLNVNGVADRSNLVRDWPAGWSFPVVPRAAADASSGWCPVSPSLTGFALSTYLNYAVDNNGTVPAYDVTVALQVDGTDVRVQRDWNWIDPGLPGQVVNLGPYAVHGGRHTVSVVYDPNNTVLENSEHDNIEQKQYVWSPYELVRDSSYVWVKTPPRGNLALANCEGFETTALPTRRIWGGIGFLPTESSADPVLRLYEPYVGSVTGYATFYAESDAAVGQTEVVLYNTAAIGANAPVYPGVFRDGGNNGGGRLQWVAAGSLAEGGPLGPYVMGEHDVLHLYQIDLDPDFWLITLDAGITDTANLAMAVYGPDTAYAGMLDSVTGFRANASTASGTEAFPFRVTTDGIHAVAVWKVGTQDDGNTASYTLTVTRDPTPPRPRIRSLDCIMTPVYGAWLEWNEEAGWGYGVECSSDLKTWSTAIQNFRPTQNGPRGWLDDGTTTGGTPKHCRFFRVFSFQP